MSRFKDKDGNPTDYSRAYHNAYFKKWKSQRRMQGFCTTCATNKPREGKKTCERCAAQRKKQYGLDSARIALAHQRRRNDVLMYYSNGTMRCACPKCPETNMKFLTLDHINGGGTEQSKKLGGSVGVYKWAIENGFPPIFQVLCYNCNCGKNK